MFMQRKLNDKKKKKKNYTDTEYEIILNIRLFVISSFFEYRFSLSLSSSLSHILWNKSISIKNPTIYDLGYKIWSFVFR